MDVEGKEEVVCGRALMVIGGVDMMGMGSDDEVGG